MEFNSFTNILFADPGLLSGIARIIDIAGVFDTYNDALSQEMADYIAIASDWRTIGMDMKAAISEYKMNVSL